MKKLFMFMIIATLLAACSTARQNTPGRTQSSQNPTVQPTLAGQPANLGFPTPSMAFTPSPEPEASNTPASTASATAVASATTGTAAPAQLQVLSSQGYTMDEGFYIVGEVQNNTDTPMGSVDITAALYSKQSGKMQQVGTEDGTTLLNVIPAKGKAPFLLGPYIMAQRVVMYDFQVKGQPASQPRQDLTEQSDNYYVAGDWLHLRGQVNNPGSSDASYVKVIVTLYDPSGNVVGAATTYTNPSDISAGGNAPFDVATEYFPNFDHYAIQIQAQ